MDDLGGFPPIFRNIQMQNLQWDCGGLPPPIVRPQACASRGCQACRLMGWMSPWELPHEGYQMTCILHINVHMISYVSWVASNWGDRRYPNLIVKTLFFFVISISIWVGKHLNFIVKILPLTTIATTATQSQSTKVAVGTWSSRTWTCPWPTFGVLKLLPLSTYGLLTGCLTWCLMFCVSQVLDVHYICIQYIHIIYIYV